MKKNLILSLLLAFIFLNQTFTQTTCLPDGITFTSQAQVDSFAILYPDCEIIEGGVILEGTAIDSLHALSGIKYIAGSLECIDNEPDTNFFAGLTGIDSIGGDFRVVSIQYFDPYWPSLSWANTKLINFQGLNNLKKVGGNFWIDSQDSLMSFTGLENLHTIEGSLVVLGAPSSFLDNLTGLNGLTEIIGDLYIQVGHQDFTGFDNLKRIGGDFVSYTSSTWGYLGLESLEEVGGAMSIKSGHDLSPLGNLTYVGSLGTFNGVDSLVGLDQLASVGTLVAGTSLESFVGLVSLQLIEEDLLINSNNLINFTGLEALQTIGGNLWMEDKENLENFIGLSGLDTIGGDLIVKNMDALQDFSGLGSLNYIGSKIEVEENPNLSSLQGLSNLQRVWFRFRIQNNPKLTNLIGLEALAIVDVLEVKENTALTSLQGLSSLTNISSSLRLEDNPALSDIQALDQMDPEDLNHLYIKDNPQLSFCSILSICTFLEEATFGNYIDISNNAPGCQTKMEVKDACQTVSVEDIIDKGTIRVSPNPTDGFIRISGIKNGIWHYRVLTTFGQVVLKGVLLQEGEIDLSNLPDDLYFVELSNERDRVMNKVVKQ